MSHAASSFVAVLEHHWNTCTLDEVRSLAHRPDLDDLEAEMFRRLHNAPPFGLAGLPDEVLDRAYRVLAMETR